MGTYIGRRDRSPGLGRLLVISGGAGLILVITVSRLLLDVPSVPEVGLGLVIGTTSLAPFSHQDLQGPNTEGIDEDNPVCLIDVFVDELDLSELGFGVVDPKATGRPHIILTDTPQLSASSGECGLRRHRSLNFS